LTQLLVNLPAAPISQINQWLPDDWKRRHPPPVGQRSGACIAHNGGIILRAVEDGLSDADLVAHSGGLRPPYARGRELVRIEQMRPTTDARGRLD
jgi:hypothetical protein